MFGFKRRAKEKWDREVDAVARDYTIDHLNNLLLHVAYEAAVAHGFSEGEANSKSLMEKQGKIVIAFEAIRGGMDAREYPDSDPLLKGGVMVAQAACNTYILTGMIDYKTIAGDLRYLLGFSRDGTEIREPAQAE